MRNHLGVLVVFPLTKGGGFGKLLNNKFANVGVQQRLWLREYQMEQILVWIKSRKPEAILGALPGYQKAIPTRQ